VKKIVIFIVGIIFTVLALGVQIQADDNLIHGCIHNNSLSMRIVSGPEQCNERFEHYISWNKEGPQGPQGPEGPQGPAGVNIAVGQQCTQGVVIGFDQDGNIICSSAPTCSDGTCNGTENCTTCPSDCGACTGDTYEIGDTGPAGGIVFYITDGGLHGLEAAPADQSSEVEWGCYGKAINGADGTAVGTGTQNTADILADCSESGVAAKVAKNYSLNGYVDWFLPSVDELNLLYQQRAVVGGFYNDIYWSSTEQDDVFAWGQYFIFPSSPGYTFKDIPLRVRAVRAF
jgi:hypothetical protein